MSSPTITKGYIFTAADQVTNTKLHNLVDLAQWAINNQAVGDIIYYNGTNWVRLPKGSNGQVLTMGTSVPYWKTP